jgi:hypothetical protein
LCFVAVIQSAAQGTLEDYQRAQRFLPGNLRHQVFAADARPDWIEKTNRFWYRRVGPKGTEFVLVDAEKNTSASAFDHARLAAALSRATKREYKPTELPFDGIEFVNEGKAIRFQVIDEQWTCGLDNCECKQEPAANPNESLSPDKRWAAYIKDHNLYLRDVSTGQIAQLTQDGVVGWDYATPLPSLQPMVEQGTEELKQKPAVFWAPDSSKLVTYRIDSRTAGRFTSIQFVPRDQLRPKAFTVVYPLPGETLPASNH